MISDVKQITISITNTLLANFGGSLVYSEGSVVALNEITADSKSTDKRMRCMARVHIRALTSPD